MERPKNAAELAQLIAGLSALPPLARARAARGLVDDAKRILSTTADEAVEEATRVATYAQVAEALGVSEASVNKAVSRYRRLVRQNPIQSP